MARFSLFLRSITTGRGLHVLALAFALLFVSTNGWAVNTAFPVLGTTEAAASSVVKAFSMAWMLIAGFSSNTAFYYLALIAALIGLLLIVLDAKYRKPIVLITWFYVLLYMVMAPYNSRFVFYPVRADAYDDGCSPNMSKVDWGTGRGVCGFTPQVVAVHVGSLLFFVFYDMFNNQQMEDSLKASVACSNFASDPDMLEQNQKAADAAAKFQGMCPNYEAAEGTASPVPAADVASGSTVVSPQSGQHVTFNGAFNDLMSNDVGYDTSPITFFTDPARMGVSAESQEWSSHQEVARALLQEVNPSSCNAPESGISCPNMVGKHSEVVSKLMTEIQTTTSSELGAAGLAFWVQADSQNSLNYLLKVRNDAAANAKSAGNSANVRSQVLNALSAGRRNGKYTPHDSILALRNVVAKNGQAAAGNVGKTYLTQSEDADKNIKVEAVGGSIDTAVAGGRECGKEALESGADAIFHQFGGGTMPANCMMELANIPSHEEALEQCDRCANYLISIELFCECVRLGGLVGEGGGGRAMLDAFFAHMGSVKSASGGGSSVIDPELSAIGDEANDQLGVALGLTGGLGGIVSSIGNITTGLIGAFSGAKAAGYIITLKIMIQLAISVMIVITPIILLMGLLIPTNAIGLLIIVTVGLFILEMVPTTMVIVDRFLTIAQTLVAEQGYSGTQAFAMNGVIALAASGIYTSIIGMTMFLLFKLGDPNNLSSLSKIDQVADKIAGAGVTGLKLIAAAAASVLGGAVAGAASSALASGNLAGAANIALQGGKNYMKNKKLAEGTDGLRKGLGLEPEKTPALPSVESVVGQDFATSTSQKMIFDTGEQGAGGSQGIDFSRNPLVVPDSNIGAVTPTFAMTPSADGKGVVFGDATDVMIASATEKAIPPIDGAFDDAVADEKAQKPGLWTRVKNAGDALFGETPSVGTSQTVYQAVQAGPVAEGVAPLPDALKGKPAVDRNATQKIGSYESAVNAGQITSATGQVQQASVEDVHLKGLEQELLNSFTQMIQNMKNVVVSESNAATLQGRSAEDAAMRAEGMIQINTEEGRWKAIQDWQTLGGVSASQASMMVDKYKLTVDGAENFYNNKTRDLAALGIKPSRSGWFNAGEAAKVGFAKGAFSGALGSAGALMQGAGSIPILSNFIKEVGNERFEAFERAKVAGAAGGWGAYWQAGRDEQRNTLMKRHLGRFGGAETYRNIDTQSQVSNTIQSGRDSAAKSMEEFSARATRGDVDASGAVKTSILRDATRISSIQNVAQIQAKALHIQNASIPLGTGKNTALTRSVLGELAMREAADGTNKATDGLFQASYKMQTKLDKYKVKFDHLQRLQGARAVHSPDFFRALTNDGLDDWHISSAVAGQNGKLKAMINSAMYEEHLKNYRGNFGGSSIASYSGIAKSAGEKKVRKMLGNLTAKEQKEANFVEAVRDELD